ncbi:hypothetical protein [Rufibacter hautae]|uniref:Uncharacterized protein n=1 Tax=Rufibacter hautae TaxID=2595005 RepID=A0A5B6TAJ2_9BACT|nr:hypothetical protein [Rufibacter hautae]KAA3436887.1 hypothetical protein FOA19_21165 [Rufibacter hautae]
MRLEEFTDMKEGLAYLNQQGYIHTFQYCPEGWLCPETRQAFAPEEMQVEACHRFQHYGGARSVAVLYAVQARNGLKGIIIDNCSTYGNAQFGEFLVRMKLHQIQPILPKQANN